MQLANFPVIRKLAFLGFLVGIFTGGVIVLFRLLVETAQSSLLPDGNIENYEALDQLWIFLLPTMGGVVLGLLFHFLSPGYRAVGVVHVMERLRYFHGHLPMTNAVVQFFAAAISIVFGHSVGREGPAIHLGAACGSLLGLWQDLPNKAQRTLIASGMAAAIAASFNTPLAGVIFATEVILLEYTIISLVPVLVAAISATVFSRIVFGNEVILVPPQAIAHMQNAELLWVVVTGLVVGVVAMVFIRSIVWFSRISSALTILTRFSLAGVVTGVVALFVPAIMSLGWDTVQSTLSNEMLMATLLILLAAKLFATCFALGLGIPAGLIGPSLFIGAVCGAIMGLIAQEMWPGSVSEPGVYALIGMGAMMSASLHAPVAAIIAILELSYSPHIILPGLCAIIFSGLVVKTLFRQPSIFLALLSERGFHYENDATIKQLRNKSALSVANRDIKLIDQVFSRDSVASIFANKPQWLVYERGDGYYQLIAAVDVLRFLQHHQQLEIELDAIPARSLSAVSIKESDNLQTAYEQIRAGFADACVILGDSGHSKIKGVLTAEDVMAFPIKA